MVEALNHRAQALDWLSLVAHLKYCQGQCIAVLPMAEAGSSIDCDADCALVPGQTAGLAPWAGTLHVRLAEGNVL